VHVAARLIGSEHGWFIALGIDVADALTEAASAEFVGATKVVDGIVSAERSDARLHGAEMLVAKWEKVGPHGKREDSTEGLRKSDLRFSESGGVDFSLCGHEHNQCDADDGESQRSDQQVHAFAHVRP